MKIARIWVVTALLSLTAPTINAQYSLLRKGDLCPFDTAVAIHIRTYRIESSKFRLCDTLVSGLQAEIRLMLSEKDVLENKLGEQQHIIDQLDSLVSSKNETIRELNLKFDTLVVAYQKKSFWQRGKGGVLFTSGVITSVLILKLLQK